MLSLESANKDLPEAILIDLFHKMVLIRRFEEMIVSVYSAQDMKTPVHLYIGQEAVAAGVCANLKKEDYIFSTHRNHGHCLAKGVDPKILYAEFYGRITGCCKGKGGSMHSAIPECGIPGTSAIVGGGIPIAVGASLAIKMKGSDRVSVAFFGDGAVDEGTFYESLNFASLKQLPVVFICENNFYATNSHLSVRQPYDNILKRVECFRIPSIQIDGNDVLAVYHSARKAIQRAREGKGPTFIECRTYRWKSHVGPDFDFEKGFRPKEELEMWMKRCPVARYKDYLIENQIINETGYKDMIKQIDAEIEYALKFAKESPFPDKNELYKDVYFENIPCPGQR